jgi:hypothetical protein
MHSGWHEARQVSVQGESIDAMEVDMPEADGGDVGKDLVGRNRPTARAAALDCLMQLPGIVGNHGVRQQRERTGNRRPRSERIGPVWMTRSS